MLRRDVVIVGGGLQGLLVLRRLTEAGFHCLLVTQGALGAGQTLHSHGLLNSGVGLVTGETQETLSQHVLPDLRRLGVPVYGTSSSYVALPEPAIEQLLPMWEANHYRPKRGDDDELPAALGPPSPVYRVPGYHVPKRQLVHALADGLQDRMVNGALAQTADGYQVRRREPPEALDVQAGAVVAAGGYDAASGAVLTSG